MDGHYLLGFLSNLLYAALKPKDDITHSGLGIQENVLDMFIS